MDATQLLAQEDHDEEALMMLKAFVLFEEDGNVTILTPIPEGVSQEEINDAVASGELTLRDGLMVLDQNHWKLENGKYLCDTGMEGEVLDEKVGPWEEIQELKDGRIKFSTLQLRRVE